MNINTKKSIVIGDLHFDDKASIIDNEKDYLNKIKVLQNQVFPYMKENNIKTLIQVGDWTSKRTQLNTYVQHHMKEDIFDYCESEDIHIYYIVGNHDIYYKNSLDIFTLEIFEKAYDNFHVIKRDEIIQFWDKQYYFIPWMLPEDEPRIQKVLKDNKVDKVFAHAEMKDFSVSKTYKSTHGLDKNYFKNIPVITGHYHLKQQKDNIFFIGTPFENTWMDFKESKGFYVLDHTVSVEEDMLFIKNDSTLMHLKVFINSEEKTIKVYGNIEAELKIGTKTDYSILKNNKVKIYLDLDNAYNKRVIEKIKEQVQSYRVEILEDKIIKEEKVEVTVDNIVEYNINSAITERLETTYQKDVFQEINKLTEIDLKE